MTVFRTVSFDCSDVGASNIHTNQFLNCVNTVRQGVREGKTSGKPRGVTLFPRSEYFPDPNSLAHGIGIAVKYVVVRNTKNLVKLL